MVSERLSPVDTVNKQIDDEILSLLEHAYSGTNIGHFLNKQDYYKAYKSIKFYLSNESDGFDDFEKMAHLGRKFYDKFEYAKNLITNIVGQGRELERNVLDVYRLSRIELEVCDTLFNPYALEIEKASNKFVET